MQVVRRLLCFCLLLTSAFAQTVRWSNAGTGDPADLQLVFDECSPDGDPVLPALNGATLNFSGKSEQTSIINFSMTRSVVLSYRLQISQAGAVQIPAFKVKTNKGELTVPAYSTATVQPGPEADVHATLQPGSSTVWAGEVFPLNYSLDVARRSFNNFGGDIEWDASPLLAEDWSKPEGSQFNRNGEMRLDLRFHTRAYAKTPGTYKLKPVNRLLVLANGTMGFGLFQQQRFEQVTSATNQPTLTVKPLPLPSPANFSGAVGELKLTSKVVPLKSAVGEPITWTLTLSGTGNWPDIAGLPQREVSKDFQVITPQAKRTPAAGKLFDNTLAEDVVLVPTQPGTYTLGSVDFTYFDPVKGAYQTIQTPPATVTVTPAPVTTFNAPPAAGAAAETKSSAAVAAPAAAENPTGLPRDPIAGAAVTAAPFPSGSWLAALCAAPFAIGLLCWLGLAAWRAKRHDPLRPRREARQRLAATLKALSTATAAERPALLIAWQHDAALFWPLTHAAPSAAALGDATWTQLWQESDRALYSPRSELPSDWLARAEAALVARKVPGFAWWRTFLPGNLLPFLGLALVLLTLPPLHAADNAPNSDLQSSISAYNEGHFDQAEAGWRNAVKQSPTNWIARHNLALALAQQEHWPEAAAEATAAFVQNPRDAAARWNLALAYSKAGYTPTALGPLLERGPLPDLARQASPAEWERIIVICAAVAALALLWLLLVAYRLSPRWSKWPALVLLLAAIILATAGLTGRAAYGVAARPTAAIVWRAGTLYSIPTEADTAQQTTPLAAGAMGTMDKTFLGWTRLTFENGQTGWVRQSELVPLWR